MVEVVWLETGGQEGLAAAQLLAKAVGLYRPALAFSLAKKPFWGRPVVCYNRVGEWGDELTSPRDSVPVEKADWQVVLDDSLVFHGQLLPFKDQGSLLVNTRRPAQDFDGLAPSVFTFDASSVASSVSGKNTTAFALLGALASLSGILDFTSALTAIETLHSGDSAMKILSVFLAAYSKFGPFEGFLDGAGI